MLAYARHIMLLFEWNTHPGSLRAKQLQEIPDELAGFFLPLEDEVVALLLNAMHQVLTPLLHGVHRLLYLVHLVLQTVLLLLKLVG